MRHLRVCAPSLSRRSPPEARLGQRRRSRTTLDFHRVSAEANWQRGQQRRPGASERKLFSLAALSTFPETARVMWPDCPMEQRCAHWRCCWRAGSTGVVLSYRASTICWAPVSITEPARARRSRPPGAALRSLEVGTRPARLSFDFFGRRRALACTHRFFGTGVGPLTAASRGTLHLHWRRTTHGRRGARGAHTRRRRLC